MYLLIRVLCFRHIFGADFVFSQFRFDVSGAKTGDDKNDVLHFCCCDQQINRELRNRC